MTCIQPNLMKQIAIIHIVPGQLSLTVRTWPLVAKYT